MGAAIAFHALVTALKRGGSVSRELPVEDGAGADDGEGGLEEDGGRSLEDTGR